MTDISPRDFGHLEAKVAELHRITDTQTKMLAHISEQMQEMQATLSEAKGGWRMLMLVGGAGAAAGTLLTKVAMWAASLPMPK